MTTRRQLISGIAALAAYAVLPPKLVALPESDAERLARMIRNRRIEGMVFRGDDVPLVLEDVKDFIITRCTFINKPPMWVEDYSVPGGVRWEYPPPMVKFLGTCEGLTVERCMFTYEEAWRREGCPIGVTDELMANHTPKEDWRDQFRRPS